MFVGMVYFYEFAQVFCIRFLGFHHRWYNLLRHNLILPILRPLLRMSLLLRFRLLDQRGQGFEDGFTQTVAEGFEVGLFLSRYRFSHAQQSRNAMRNDTIGYVRVCA